MHCIVVPKEEASRRELLGGEEYGSMPYILRCKALIRIPDSLFLASNVTQVSTVFV